MDLLTFITKIVESLAWPMTVIIIANYFGEPLKRIIEVKSVRDMSKVKQEIGK